MRRFLWTPLVLALGLVACNPGGSGFACEGGICLNIKVEEPVQAVKPSLVTLTVRTMNSIPKLGVGLDCYPEVAIEAPLTSPEGADLVQQNERVVTWSIDTKGGQEYSISAYVVLDQSAMADGVFGYQINALASHPTMGIARDSVTIYLDAEGKQTERPKSRGGTPVLIPATVVTATPGPSPTPTATLTPTATATPTPTLTPTPTEAPYPPPGEGLLSPEPRAQTPLAPYPQAE